MKTPRLINQDMLGLAGWLYGKITDLRNALYDRGVFKTHPLGARTISIGNITTGGTGKTPVVACVAEMLADAGEKVCILTRGYGRKSSGRVLVSDGNKVLVDAVTGGDEPVELARKLIGKAIVIADADRVAAARWAKAEFGVSSFVLDDGFQHRRAKRDLDIICVDATQFHSQMLPAGNLREPLANLSRADAIIITRSDQMQDIGLFVSGMQMRAPTARVFRSEMEVSGLVELGSFLNRDRTTANPTHDAKFLAYSALGNPESFFLSLRDAGFHLQETKVFRDHHYYTQDDILSIEDSARRSSCTALLTTSKDAVKLEGLKFEIPCYVVQAEVKIEDPQAFRELITSS